MVVFSHEKEEASMKKKLVTVEKNSRFIRGLTAENTNCQISQNRARFVTFKIAPSPNESLVDLKHRPFFRVTLKKLQNFPRKQKKFSMIHRPAGGYHQRSWVFCLWFIIAQLLCLQYLSGVPSLKVGNQIGQLVKLTNGSHYSFQQDRC